MTTLSVFKFIEEFFRVTWLSVSSTKFYSDLYSKYKGNGLKYAAMVVTITSIFYGFFLLNTMATIRHHLMNADDDNPIEHMIKQWPEVKYNGKEISIAEEEPVRINTKSGKALIVIDPEGILNAQQKSEIPILLLKNQLILHLETSNGSTPKPKETAFGYNIFFGTEPVIIDQPALKEYLLNMLQPLGLVLLFIVIPIIIIVRLSLYLMSNIFSILLLYLILWWMRLEPTIKSSTRIIIFASGAAEILSAILLIFAPQALALCTLLEYWTIILAVYSLIKMSKK